MDSYETPSKYTHSDRLKSPEASVDNSGMQAVRLGQDIYLRKGLPKLNFFS